MISEQFEDSRFNRSDLTIIFECYGLKRAHYGFIPVIVL